MIIWHFRDHGYATLPEGRVGSKDFSRDLIALLDHLNIKCIRIFVWNYRKRIKWSDCRN